MSDLEPDERARLKSLYQRFTGREKVFDLSLSVGGRNHTTVLSMAVRITTAMQFDNGLKLKPYWIFGAVRNALCFLLPMPLPSRRMLWSAEELAQILHLPDGDHPVMERIPHLKEGERMLAPEKLADGITVGKLRHPIQNDRSVRIPREQFTKHWFLSGQTGSGKSSTALQMVQSLIDQWTSEGETDQDDPYRKEA